MLTDEARAADPKIRRCELMSIPEDSECFFNAFDEASGRHHGDSLRGLAVAVLRASLSTCAPITKREVLSSGH